jgi:hypothetical protein
MPLPLLEADMAFLDLFGRKEPTASHGDVWKVRPTFLGAALLLQFIPEERGLLTDQELADLTAPFSPEIRKLAALWIVVYVTWLMRLLVNCKFDEDYADRMMAAVYERIATNETRLPGIESIADGIKYWFRELDDGVRDAIKDPMTARGGKLAAVHALAVRFLTRDSSSPFRGAEDPQFDDIDIELAHALEEAKNISKARIDSVIATTKKMPQ